VQNNYYILIHECKNLTDPRQKKF